MGKAKGSRIGRGVVDMSSLPADADFMDQFPPEERHEPSPLTYDLDGYRIVQKWVDWQGQVVWFAVMHQTLRGDKWVDVVRFDTCHSEAHIHRFTKTGRESRRRVVCSLHSVDDVHKAWDIACERVFEEADENQRRWNRGR